MNHKVEILQKFKNVPKDIQIVCVGTTQAHFAIDFADAPVQGFNMALYLNPVIFHQALLEKYEKRIQKNAVVLITLQYPIFCIGCFEKIARKNAVQYARLLPGRNPYIPMIRQFCLRFYPACMDGQMQNFLSFKNVEERNKYVNHYKPWEWEKLCKNLIEYGWEKEIGITDYVMEGHKKSSKKADMSMKHVTAQIVKLIYYCRKMGCRPVLLGLPYSNVLNQYVPDSFKRKCFYRNIQYIQERTSCKFLDYSADERMQDMNNYMDVWFLNERGRKKFTQIVLEDVM